MTWFKVDDGLAFHAKVVQAGNAAMGLWVRAGSWSAQQLTNGFVPDHIVTTIGTRGQAKALLDARLWVRAQVEGKTGYQFHGWNEEGRQPTREQVEKDRAEARERMKKAREERKRSKDVRANTGRTSGDVRSTRPDPTRPDPSSTGYEEEGGHVPDVRDAPPTWFTDHCEQHADDPTPPACGRCADTRKANAAAPRAPLALVTDRLPCLVHMESDVTHCRGCAADRKAADSA